MFRTTEQWVEYLTERAKSEGVEIYPAFHLWGWVNAGVEAEDDEENVWAAMLEVVNPS